MIQTVDKDLKAAESTPPLTVEVDDYPDGGFEAWLVILGTACTNFSTFGFVNAWGVFQAYYEKHLLIDSPPSDIAWIGSIQYALAFFPGLIVGRLFDIGYFKVIFMSASAFLIMAVFLIAECTRYWQFVLCQGIAVGLACGTLFAPQTPLIGHWFKKKRGLASGVSAIGSSVGGTIFPIISRNLINHVGFRWAMRIVGFILIFSLGVANLTLKRRLPPTNKPGGTFNLSIFKSLAFSLYCLSSFFSYLGLYTVLTYIDASAVSVGIDENFAFYLVSITNASSGFARITFGAISDRLGTINVLVPMSIYSAILTFVWPLARDKCSFIAIAIFYGIGSGTYVSIFSNPTMAMGETEDVGRRLGMFFMITAAGAMAGPPISGAINTATHGYKVVGYYAGSMIMVSVILMAICRHVVLGRLWGKF